MNAGIGLISRTKYFGGIKGFLRNGFNLTLTLIVMSREDSRLGQPRDLVLNPVVLLTSWVNLGNLLDLSELLFTHKRSKNRWKNIYVLPHTAWYIAVVVV